MTDNDYSAAIRKLQTLAEMTCDKELSLKCKSCDYYYEYKDRYRIMACLKQDIRGWTLYRLDKEVRTK